MNWFRSFHCRSAGLGLVLLTLAAHSTAIAQDDPTNELWLVSPPLTLNFDDSLTSSDWRACFDRELLKKQTLIFDRLGPPAGFQFTRESQVRRYGMASFVGSRAAGTLARALQDSAQEAALAIFPVDQWLDILPLERWQNAAQRLFEGAFGNTTEQELSDLPTSYSAAESDWRRADHDATLRYGLRPRAAPYLYVASQIGHFDGRPALYIDARARYLPFNRFQTTFEATAALPNSFELTFSAISEPLRASETTSLALRLQRVIGEGPSACAVFLGFLRSSAESAIVFGASRPW